MPLTVPVLRVLEACRGDRITGPLILRPTSGKPIDRRDAYRMVARVAKAAQLPRTSAPTRCVTRRSPTRSTPACRCATRSSSLVTPTRGPPSTTTVPAETSTDTASTSSPPTSPACSRQGGRVRQQPRLMRSSSFIWVQTATCRVASPKVYEAARSRPAILGLVWPSSHTTAASRRNPDAPAASNSTMAGRARVFRRSRLGLPVFSVQDEFTDDVACVSSWRACTSASAYDLAGPSRVSMTSVVVGA
jgi:hypothetical protein